MHNTEIFQVDAFSLKGRLHTFCRLICIFPSNIADTCKINIVSQLIQMWNTNGSKKVYTFATKPFSIKK